MISVGVTWIAALLGACRVLAQGGIQVDWENDDSIIAAAGVIARDTMEYYEGTLPGHTEGLLYLKPDPELWWWAGGALFGNMIDYWHYTGDSTWNEIIVKAMVHQAGPNQDFLTPNWTAHMGNDDQGFWGMSAMTAAEVNFDNPPPDQPQWLATAQGVFNTMAAPDRHDTVCGGGLRWQLSLYSKGYNYKNSISNGILFNLGARLARYTGNSTYEEWANKIWNWERSVGLINEEYAVFDGAKDANNCSEINTAEFTYNSGVFLQGAAYLYNHTNGNPEWQKRTEGLLNHMLATFFPKNIATEVVCQNDEKNLCLRDALIFKGVIHRWLANVAQVAPFTDSKIAPVLRASAKAAAGQCTGGENGRSCGFQWSSGVFDGQSNVATEMSTLSAVISTLYKRKNVAPVTKDTGGTSKGDASAGSTEIESKIGQLPPITTAARVGASFLTLTILIGLGSVLAWMVLD